MSVKKKKKENVLEASGIFSEARELRYITIMLFILRLLYVRGDHGSPVCSKRSVPWKFGHIFLCFQDLLRFVKFFTLHYDIRNKPW